MFGSHRYPKVFATVLRDNVSTELFEGITDVRIHGALHDLNIQIRSCADTAPDTDVTISIQ